MNLKPNLAGIAKTSNGCETQQPWNQMLQFPLSAEKPKSARIPTVEPETGGVKWGWQAYMYMTLPVCDICTFKYICHSLLDFGLLTFCYFTHVCEGHFMLFYTDEF